MWNLAEVSIGLNPYSRPGGSALELEGIVGGAHVAVGNNVAYGGSIDARSHIDCALLEATLALDGEALDPVGRGGGGRRADRRSVLELAAIAAPTFAERPRIDWLEQRLAARPAPLPRRRRESDLDLGEGRPRLLVAAHVDTVFPAETVLRFERDDSWLVGPGIGDNAAAVVVALHVVGELLERQEVAPGASCSPSARRASATCAGSQRPAPSSSPRRWSRWRATASST